jgi:hypothetical protein
MRLEIPNCPVCGCNAWCVVHSQLIYTEVTTLDDHGRIAHTGESESDYPKPVENSDGRRQVLCEEGHAWFTFIDD